MTGTSDRGTAELLRVVGIRKGRLGVPTVGQTNVHRPYENRIGKLQRRIILSQAKDPWTGGGAISSAAQGSFVASLLTMTASALDERIRTRTDAVPAHNRVATRERIRRPCIPGTRRRVQAVTDLLHSAQFIGAGLACRVALRRFTRRLFASRGTTCPLRPRFGDAVLPSLRHRRGIGGRRHRRGYRSHCA